MKRRWCLREDAFEKDDGLWWINREQHDNHKKTRTPMATALRNGEISKIIDVKFDGLSAQDRKRGIF